MINKIIKILIGADMLFMTAAGFLDPIFSIFLVKSIENGTMQLAGTAVAILWLTKSVIRIPVAHYLDKKKGENDDFYSIIIGFSICALAHFLYYFARMPIHIYAIQILMGIGAAFAYSSWYGFFSRHLDKGRENLEWSIEVSLVGFGIAGAGFLTGEIAEKFGFAPIFLTTGTMFALGVLLLSLLGKNIKRERKHAKV